jgi:hypothetical protein
MVSGERNYYLFIYLLTFIIIILGFEWLTYYQVMYGLLWRGQ